jgi:hypothetical protein
LSRTVACHVISKLEDKLWILQLNQGKLSSLCIKNDDKIHYNKVKLFPNTRIFKDLYPEGIENENFWEIRYLDLDNLK